MQFGKSIRHTKYFDLYIIAAIKQLYTEKK